MKLALLVVSVLFVAGCATKYQPVGATGGFSEMRRGDFTYVVRFEGNGYTRQVDAEEMVFLRAAELTIEKGYKFFAVLSESSHIDSSSFTTPTQSTIRGSIDSFGNYRGRAVTTGGQRVDIDRPRAHLLIGVSNDRFGNYEWVEASRVVNELTPKYKRK